MQTYVNTYKHTQHVHHTGGVCGVYKNEPRGCVFWFEIPYVPVTSGSEKDIIWNVESDLDSALKTAFDDVAARQSSFDVGGVERVPSNPCSDGSRSKDVSLDEKIIVLLIEDDVPTRKLMTRALEKKGYMVVQAPNGAEGLELLKKRRYNMVLCDIMMPVMDGLECMKRFRLWEQSSEEAEERRSRGMQVRACFLLQQSHVLYAHLHEHITDSSC
jgi:CheY-like chemotaxis protein